MEPYTYNAKKHPTNIKNVLYFKGLVKFASKVVTPQSS